MYSVCRIFSENRENFPAFASRPDSPYEFAMQKNGGGKIAVCDISKDGIWERHKKDLEKFIGFIMEERKAPGRADFRLKIDTAVDCDDMAGQDNALFLCLESPLLRAMGEAGIDFEISIYKGEA